MQSGGCAERLTSSKRQVNKLDFDVIKNGAELCCINDLDFLDRHSELPHAFGTTIFATGLRANPDAQAEAGGGRASPWTHPSN